MEKNCFELIYDIIAKSGRMNSFAHKKTDEYTAEFKSNDALYQMIYELAKTQVILSVYNNRSEKYDAVSSWLLDFEKSTGKDVDLISKDFIDTMAPQQKAVAVNNHSQKKKKDAQNNGSIMFFMNRMASVFPEIKDIIQAEKNAPHQFRVLKLVRENVVPQVNALLGSKDKPKINKFGKSLSELYENGDDDVKAVITMAILNGIDSQEHFEIACDSVSDGLQHAAKAAQKFKDKKVKPEKVRTKKSFLSRLLDAEKNMQ